MSLSPESSFSAVHIEADISSNVASSMVESTPPTTVADTASLHSDLSKHDVITVDVAPLPSPEPHDGTPSPGLHPAAVTTTVITTTVATPAVATPVVTPAVTPAPDNASVSASAPPSAVASDGRVRRSRGGAAPVYNLAKLSGTDGHGKRRAKGDIVSNRRRRKTLGATTSAELARAAETPSTPAEASTPARNTIDALNLSWSPKNKAPKTTKAATATTTRQPVRESPRVRQPTSRASSAASLKLAAAASKKQSSTTTTTTTATKGKGRTAVAKPLIKAPDKPAAAPAPAQKIPRELRRLQDTKEFAHIDEQPIVYTVWAKGKYVHPNEKKDAAPAAKRAKRDQDAAAEEQAATAAASAAAAAKESAEPSSDFKKQRRVKKYLDKGLYAGQETPENFTWGLTPAEKKTIAQFPELKPSTRPNKVMPPPMFNGLRTLIAGRDFKLPFQVCNPLPPGQPKPDEWKKMTKNRFIGESREIWRKSPHFHDYQSKCVCTPEDGCTESCQNRIMLYECDKTNCNVGEEFCQNRAFADLTARRNKGGKYRVGVEVIKTSDRGHGVRSNRCFEPHQIIMEYAGEIITEEECERRMNEVYKDNECYYLMSFDQNMIIDATTGSIARFVNHSCNPNCRMIKWIVSGQPRMALFAGDKPIMTGDELTYDYNFDPFSAKNVQKCLCGEPNCRGVLGPKPREVKPSLKNMVANTVKAGKRKLQQMMGKDGEGAKDDNDGQPKRKKTKVQTAKVKPITSTKEALASVGLKVSKGAATAIRKSVSTLASGAKKVAFSAQTEAKQRARTSAVLKKTATTRVIKPYGRKTPAKRVTTKVTKPAKGSAGTTAASRARSKVAAAAAVGQHIGKGPWRGGMIRKTPFDRVSQRKRVDEYDVEESVGVEVRVEAPAPGWETSNRPREASDSEVDGGAITVAALV